MFLEGIRIVSLAHFLQGPSAAQLLGDLGADVIKVEPPEGSFERHWSAPDNFLNGESVFYLLAGRNQRNLALDLRTDEGKAILERLLSTADVLIDSFRPGVLERLGFGWEEMRTKYPRLIYSSMSGYGPDGPYKSRVGQDILIQALSGLLMLSGKSDDPPTPVGASLVDQHSAALAAFGIVAALFGRSQSGQGQRVDANLLSAALDLQIEPLSYYLNGSGEPSKSTTGVSSPYYRAPYGVFRTSDSHLCLSLNPLDRLAKVFGNEAILHWEGTDEFASRDEINGLVAREMLKRSTAEWIPLFDEHRVWYARIQSYSDVESDPQVRWNRSIISMDHPVAGTVRTVGHPLKYNGHMPETRRVPPATGEHTVEILTELGYSKGDIADMEASGVTVSNSGP